MRTERFEVFLAETFGGRPCQMDTSIYAGTPFDCACGQKHLFDHHTQVLRELVGQRLVFGCPDSSAVTCVKMKGFFKFKGFESVLGCIDIPDEAENSDDSDSSEDDVVLVKLVQDGLNFYKLISIGNKMASAKNLASDKGFTEIMFNQVMALFVFGSLDFVAHSDQSISGGTVVNAMTRLLQSEDCFNLDLEEAASWLDMVCDASDDEVVGNVMQIGGETMGLILKNTIAGNVDANFSASGTLSHLFTDKGKNAFTDPQDLRDNLIRFLNAY
ncbi:hypothetical protein A9Q83_01370 [Alphaproteobacteria bacterium 46_93_T64]|nr:hypothetical protein A9Q83_01370 [Alphaproteobacteria bacterium 46_93_T64]